ncbi:MAG: Rrf2 family transcriptional regulator [Oscillospiraceae bacterium]|nr:Rrf2 family transcriptional regulator [Oscillospiraceae bacterium]
MLVSTKGRYALRVMVELATSDSEEFIPLKQIADNQEISEKYLEAIMKNLVREGLVVGLRGKGGGYKLSKNPSLYTVADILHVTEGSLAPVTCLEDKSYVCPRMDRCSTLSMWKKLDTLISEFFEGITLKDLADEASDSKGDFYAI